MRIATMTRGFLPAPHPIDMTNAPSDIAVAVAEGLTAAGHDVTFFGPSGTRLPHARVATAGLSPLVRQLNDLAEIMAIEAKSSHNLLGLWDQYLAEEMFERASRGEFDVLHFHHPEAALPFARRYPDVPVVFTLHDPVDPWFSKAMRLYGSPNQFYVSISDSQRKSAPDLPYLATVHNGIDTKLFEYSDEADDYLLFSGRIMPEKGVTEAIAVAQATGSRLYIIGAVYEKQQHYFDTQVKPHLNEKIQYLGFLKRDETVAYYRRARALLFPISWEEPFGLTMIEAMACGTPVIATPRGSVREVVADGTTGFIVRSVQDMARAVGRLDEISRADCRKHAVQHFSNETMVRNYAAALATAYAAMRRPKFAPTAPWARRPVNAPSTSAVYMSQLAPKLKRF